MIKLRQDEGRKGNEKGRNRKKIERILLDAVKQRERKRWGMKERKKGN